MLMAGTLPVIGLESSPVSASGSYTVTYDGNGHDGGSVPVDMTSYGQGDAVLVHDNSNGLTKEGFLFGGWNTAANGSGTDYLPGQTFTMGTQNVTLYAKWIHATTNWTDRSSVSSNLNDMVYSDGVFYAVGKSGSIASSVDGTIWTKQTSVTAKDLYGITSGDGKLVAVGANGTILVSANGEDWSYRPSGTAKTLRGIAYGNGLYLAVGDGGTIVASRNGSYWTPVSSGTTMQLNDVTYASGKFIVVGNLGTILTSSDGQAWTARDSGVMNDFLSIAVGGGRIVAVGLLGTVVTSDDGTSWTKRVSGIFSELSDITYGNGLFIAVGSLFSEINYSADGISWTSVSVDFSVRKGVAYGNGLYVVVGDSGIATSANGTSWAKYQHPSFNGMAYGNGKFVAAGAGGAIYSSEYGAKWKKMTSNTTNELRGITYGGGLYVAVGDGGTILTSSDGADWTVRTSPTSNRLNGVVYGNGKFVAVGESGTVVYSVYGGVDWTLADTGFPDLNMRAVAYGLGQFAAVGPAGIYSSSDGENWTESAVSGVELSSIAASGTLLVAAGLSTEGDATLNVYTSGDGSNWIRSGSGVPQPINGAAYDNGTFVLVGNGGVIRISKDGTTYTGVTSGLPASASLRAVAGGDGTFVAAGLSGAMAQTPKAAPANYAIHFHENGGDTKASPAFMMLSPGESIGVLPTPPSRSGYAFAGWNTKADGSGTALNESYVMAADSVAYAQWVTVPSAPANLTGTAKVGEVDLSWDAVAGAEHYAVYRYEGEAAPADPGEWVLVQDHIAATAYTVTGLTDGKTYAFAVKATNAAGTSGYSEAATATPGGKGTADDPYIITTAQRLNEVREHLDAHYVLASDIDLSGYGDWMPIGMNTTPFTGHFDGNGHTISGMKVVYSLGGEGGLFGTIGSGGKVQNLVLSNVNISMPEAIGPVGALAGQLEGEVSQIRVTGGTVTGNSSVGGLVGTTSGGAVITASCTGVKVEGTLFSTGGLVGFLQNALVDASCSTGEVSGNAYVGGLAGSIEESVMTDSYATGPVAGYFTVGGLIGGVLYNLETGEATSTLERVYAAGKVENLSLASASGLIGANTAPINLNSVYYDKDMTGQSDTQEFSGIPLAHEDMGKEASFAGWNFDTLWHLDSRIGTPAFLRDDNLAPAMSGANISNEAPDKVVVHFSEQIEADDAALARFKILVNGSEAPVAGKQLNGKELILTLGQPVLNGQEVRIAYAEGDPADPAVTDKKQNRMASQTIQAVNGVEPILVSIVSFAPADKATGVAADQKLVLTFNKTVEAMPGKYIYLMTEGDAVAEKIEASSSQVQVADHVVTITPASGLLPLRGYYVLIDDGAFRHSADDVHGGLSNPATWNFMAAPDPAAQWVLVGPPGMTEGKASSPVLKAGADGTLYVLFRDEAHGGKATVMKLGQNDAQWTLVGSAGFSPGAVGAPSLLVDGDVLYAAFGVVDSNHLASVHVMKYELGGTGDWTPAGDSIAVGYTDPELLADQDSAPFLLAYNGDVYIAYRDGTVSGAMTVRKWSEGGHWETVGDAGFSAGDIYDPSLVVLDGTLYAGFTDYTFDAGYGATVMKFDPVSGSWQPVGGRGFTSGIAFDTSLVSDGKRLVVAYENMDHQASAMAFDFEKGEWVTAGNGFSADQAFGMAAAAENGGLYAAYQDSGLSGRVAVKKYAVSGWVAVGTLGFSPGQAYNPSLIVHDGIPYVAYEDRTSGGKLSVMKYGAFTPANSTISPEAATFDKNAANPGAGQYADVTVTIALNGNTLYSISNGGATLAGGTDYKVAGHTVTIKKEYLAKQPVGTTVLTFTFSQGSAQTLKITINDSTPADEEDDAPTQPEEPTNTETKDTSVNVLINGKEEKAGTATTSARNGQTVLTIAIDPVKLEERLAAEGPHAVVTIPAPSGSDVVVGELNGQMIKSMEDRQAILQIKTDRAIYTIPAQQINISAISAQMGTSAALQDIKIQVEIGAPAEETAKLVEHAADGTFTLVAAPVEFTVRATYGETTIEISKFSAYVERTIAIPGGVDPNKITTAVVIEPDGTPRHVPTKIVLVDNQYYAVINSLTNSTYTVVWHPVEFGDVAEHWAKDTVNHMGSRMVIEGTGGGEFSPDRDITRGEFAAIIVRALGLGLEKGSSVFSDVNESDWFNSAVHTAYAYGLLDGFEDGTFRPDDKITREQAVVIIAKAMALTGLKAKLPDQPAEAALRAYADATQVSDWAIGGMADCVQAGIVSGRNDSALAPLDSITRAEAAAIVERLLLTSDLI